MARLARRRILAGSTRRFAILAGAGHFPVEAAMSIACVVLAGQRGFRAFLHSGAGKCSPESGSRGTRRACAPRSPSHPAPRSPSHPAATLRPSRAGSRGVLARPARGYFGFAAIPPSRSAGCGSPIFFHSGCKGAMVLFCAENGASSDGLPQEASAWPDGLIPFYAKRTASLRDNIQYDGWLGTTKPPFSIHIFVHLNNHVLPNAQIYS